MTCEYMAQQEGVLCEEVLLLSESNEDVNVKVKVHARVMGKGCSRSHRGQTHTTSQIMLTFARDIKLKNINIICICSNKSNFYQTGTLNFFTHFYSHF